MSIDTNGASAYFTEHPRASVWQGAAPEAQQAALTHARRQLARTLGRGLNDAEAAYIEGDTSRDEYAVYEQALYLLQNHPGPNVEGSVPGFVSQDPAVKNAGRPGGAALLAPETLRWLGVTGPGAIIVSG
jgi:hypothetical protein